MQSDIGPCIISERWPDKAGRGGDDRMRDGRGSRKHGNRVEEEDTETVNIKTADSTYRVSADIIGKGGKDGERNNTRKMKSDKTIKYSCI